MAHAGLLSSIRGRLVEPPVAEGVAAEGPLLTSKHLARSSTL